MSHRAKSRLACFGVLIALGLATGAGPAMAMAQQPMAPSSGGSAPAPVPPADKTSTGMLEGVVKKVDPGAGNLQVSSGPLGIFGKTLEVTDSTQIRVEGRQGTLADIREGAKVKASYESHDGKVVATQIEVTPVRSDETGKPPAKSQ